MAHFEPEQWLTFTGIIRKTQEIRKNKGYTKYSYLYLQYLTRESLAKMMESGIGYIYYAEKDGSIQCMNFLILKDRKACGLLTGSTAEGYKIGLPSFLKYIVIDQLKEQEYLYLNLGGSPNKNHSGIAAFKLSLGCTEVWKSGFSTNYLLFPYKLINPVLMAGRMLPDNALFRKIKKMI